MHLPTTTAYVTEHSGRMVWRQLPASWQWLHVVISQSQETSLNLPYRTMSKATGKHSHCWDPCSSSRPTPPNADWTVDSIRLLVENTTLATVLSITQVLHLWSARHWCRSIPITLVLKKRLELFLFNLVNKQLSYSWFTESHSYGTSLAIWDHSVTCHPTQVNAPHLNPSQ